MPTTYTPILALATLLLLAGCETGTTDPDTAVDLIVEGMYVLTMDDQMNVIPDGAVAVDAGVIVAVGSAAEINATYTATEHFEGENRVVMPGLINGHTHAAMTLLRGVADDLELMTWLNDYIFPAEAEFVDSTFVRVGTELACWEMIRGGTTTFVDMYYFPDAIAEVVADCGLRALVATTVIGQSSPDGEGFDDDIRSGQAFIERWSSGSGGSSGNSRNSRITPIVGPHSVYTLDEEQLRATRQAANNSGAPVSIHVSESPFEIEYSKQHYETTPVDLLNDLGFFDGTQTIAAHMVWPTADEIRILAEKGVGVIHNPTSNMKLASGTAPVAEMLRAGVEVGLGTDGAASNNDLDMWEEMRIAALQQKVAGMDPTALPASAVLRMATHGSATAIGMGDTIGTLTPGRRADLIQVSFSAPHFVPAYNVISHLVYVADEQDVVTTIVDGRVLMKDDEILTIDTERVRSEANALASKIQDALSVAR